MLVFAGLDATHTDLNDLWAFQPAADLGTWTPITPLTVPPPARDAHTAV